MMGAEGPAARSPRLCCVRKGGPAPSGDLGCETDAVTETVPGTAGSCAGGRGLRAVAPHVPTNTPERAPRGLSECRLLHDPAQGGVGGSRAQGLGGSCASEHRGNPCLRVRPTRSLLRPAVSRLQLSRTVAGPGWSLFLRLTPETPPVASAAPPPPPTASSRLCTPAGPVGSRSRQASHRGPGNAEGARELDLCWDASQPLSQGQPPLHLMAPGTP